MLGLPKQNYPIEFWPKGQQIKHDQRGVCGTFDKGSFWSKDKADHWSPKEISLWCYLPSNRY